MTILLPLLIAVVAASIGLITYGFFHCLGVALLSAIHAHREVTGTERSLVQGSGLVIVGVFFLGIAVALIYGGL